jgi:hypothetical protein
MPHLHCANSRPSGVALTIGPNPLAKIAGDSFILPIVLRKYFDSWRMASWLLVIEYKLHIELAFKDCATLVPPNAEFRGLATHFWQDSQAV